MSYCRFSSNDFRCDFYAYGSTNGYDLHIACQRVIWEPPPSPYAMEFLDLPHDEWSKIYKTYFDAFDAAPHEDIELDGAGDYVIYNTLQEMRDGIAEYIERGFQAPDWLLPMLDEEIQLDNDTATED